MKHVKTIFPGNIIPTHEIGCGECQTSCQSACKTSCTVANQSCEQIGAEALQATTLRKTSLHTRVNRRESA